MPLKLWRRKPGGNWYVRGTIAGSGHGPVFRSTGFADRPSAEIVLAEVRDELTGRRLHGDRARATFDEALALYLARCPEAEKPQARRLEPWFGGVRLAELDVARVERWLESAHAGHKPSTINRRLTTLAAVLNGAVRARLMDPLELPWRSDPGERVRWLDPAERRRLDQALPGDPLEALTVFLLETGCRLSEALRLDWRDVDLGRRRVAFLDTKDDGKARGIPLGEPAWLQLANLQHRGGRVFLAPAITTGPRPRRRGPAPWTDDKGRTRGELRRRWRQLMAAAAIDDFTPHDCRHDLATRMVRAGVHPRDMMEWFGWQSPAMLVRYGHVNPDHLSGILERLNHLEAGNTPNFRDFQR